jgi:hypothetical protein
MVEPFEGPHPIEFPFFMTNVAKHQFKIRPQSQPYNSSPGRQTPICIPPQVNP